MRHRRSRGFTLIELLIVVAIIAILISLLIPSLKGARESGWMVKCQSNQRQIGVASELYSNEFDDWVIREAGTGQNHSSCSDRGNWGWRYPWPRAWRPYLDSTKMWAPTAISGSSWGQEYKDHYENAEYYHDPAYPWEWHQIHYANNGMDLYTDENGNLRWLYYKPLTKRHAIKFPGSTFAMTAYQDDDDGDRYEDLYRPNMLNRRIAIWYDIRSPVELREGNRLTRASPTRHGFGSNVLRFDGHSSWEPRDVIIDAANWDDHDDTFSWDRKCYHRPKRGLY